MTKRPHLPASAAGVPAMAAAHDQSPVGPSPLRSPSTSQRSTRTFSSDGEDAEGETESPKEGPSCSEEDEFPGENGSVEHGPEEDGCLQEEEVPRGGDSLYPHGHLYEEQHPESRENLPRGAGPRERDDLYDNDALEGEFEVASTSQTQPTLNIRGPATGSPQTTVLLAAPTPASDSAREPHGDRVPSASSTKDGREFRTWKDRSTQTKWPYKTDVSVVTKMPEEENGATADGSGADLVDSLVNDPADLLDIEDVSDSAVFEAVVREPTTRSEQEEAVDIPPTSPLEGEARRRLGTLLKKNFEKFKEMSLWIVKQRENSLSPKAGGVPTITYCFGSQSSEGKEPERQEGKKLHHAVRRGKLEIDTEWPKNKIEVRQDDAKLDFYPDESVFRILFPDGSGQIHYPSGNLALLVLGPAEGKFTYLVLDDSPQMQIQALVDNAGHATFHDEDGEIWLSLSPALGYYFAKDQAQKAWNWWDLGEHVHAPPLRPVCLRLNPHIEVQVRSQDTVNFHFAHQRNHVCLNLGTKYKFMTPEMLSRMKNRAALEVDAGALVRKVRVLLGKMSRLVTSLSILDVENFLGATSILLIDNTGLTRKFRARVEAATTLVHGSFSSS